jgi:uncharacterized protein (DUF2141 family)
MRGAIPLLSQYAFMAWCLAKAQGQLYVLLYILERRWKEDNKSKIQSQTVKVKDKSTK